MRLHHYGLEGYRGLTWRKNLKMGNSEGEITDTSGIAKRWCTWLQGWTGESTPEKPSSKSGEELSQGELC